MSPEQVIARANEWIELAKQRANPELELLGGYRRQAIPLDAGELLECLNVSPVRQHPRWAAFCDRLRMEVNGRRLLVKVPDIESIILAMTPEKVSAKKEPSNG